MNFSLSDATGKSVSPCFAAIYFAHPILSFSQCDNGFRSMSNRVTLCGMRPNSHITFGYLFPIGIEVSCGTYQEKGGEIPPRDVPCLLAADLLSQYIATLSTVKRPLRALIFQCKYDTLYAIKPQPNCSTQGGSYL